MLSRSNAGTPLLYGSDTAVRQCQVGCIAHTSQHPLRERSTLLFSPRLAVRWVLGWQSKSSLVVLTGLA